MRFVGSLILFFGLLPVTFASAAQITYHGRLLKPDNTPVLSSNVQFRLQVRSPGSESCLFFDEIHSRDMSVSDGNFAITLGDGTASSVNTEPFSLERAFQNRGTFTFAGGKCAGGGTTYSPAATDGRKLVLQFNDGSGWETVPTQSINQVPQAAEAMSVGGYRAGDLFRVVDGSGNPVALSAWAQSDYTNLLSIISSGNVSGNSAGFTGVLAGDVSGAQGATLVGKIQGRAVDATAPTTGQVLKWNGSAWAPGADSGGSGSVLTVASTGAIQITGTATDPIIGVQDASTSQKGVVQLASSSDTTAGLVVQANDSRLADSRAPNGSAGGDLAGNYPSPTLALFGTAGSYYKVTTDSKGRVASGVASLNYDDISNAPSSYLNYKPNNSACADGQVIKWVGASQRWECANDAGAAGTVASLTVNSPLVKTGTSADPILSLQDASTSQKGAVQLASSADTTAGLVVQANDARLTDARAPTAHHHNIDEIDSAAAKYFSYKPNNAACANNEILKWDNSNSRWICATAGSLVNAESTTASNVGTAGVGVFKQLSSSDLQFKKLNAASNITLTDDTGNSKIDVAVNLGGVFGNNTGLIVSDGTQLQNKACSANQILKWLSPTGWTCAADDGLTSETDPKVGANTANYLSKWNGSALVASAVMEGGGNVGIGTNSANYNLDVRGGGLGVGTNGSSTARLELGENATGSHYTYIDLVGDTTYTDYGLRIFRDNTGANAASTITHRGTGDLSLVAQDAGGLVLSTSNSDRLHILANGNVGIGSTNPVGKLDVNGAVNATTFTGGFVNTGGMTGAGSINLSPTNTTATAGFSVTNNLSATYSPASAPAVNTYIYSLGSSLTSAGTADLSNARLTAGVAQANHNTNSNMTAMTGFYSSSQNSGTGTMATSNGIEGYAINYAGGTITSGTAGVFAALNQAGGTMTGATGISGSVNNTSTGTITTAIGGVFAVSKPAGTITTGYGVYVGSVQATNKWSLFAADAAAPVYVAGSVGIGSQTPTSTLQVVGSVATSISAKTSAYTLTASDNIVTGNASGGAFSLTLPTAVGIAGRQYTLKKVDSSANAVTVATTSSQTIDGSTTFSLSSQYKYVTVVSDGANWNVTGSNASGGGLASCRMCGRTCAGYSNRSCYSWSGWTCGAYSSGNVLQGSGVTGGGQVYDSYWGDYIAAIPDYAIQCQ